jgi:hypothetical protein
LNVIVLWSFVLFGVSMVLFGAVRATGAVMPPLFILIISLWCIRVPFAYGMLGRWQAEAIWWSFPLASLMSTTLATAYYRFGGWRKLRLGRGRCPRAGGRGVSSAGPARSARPLVVRCGAFGDMVLVTALIRDLSARFGGPVDVLTSGPWSEPLLRGQPGVGDVVTVRSRKTPYWLSRDQQRAVRWLRARGAGPTWCCDGNEAARPMLSRAGVPEQFIVDSRDHPLLAGEHATEQWRRLAQILPAAGVSPPVSPSPESARSARRAWSVGEPLSR